MKHIILGLALCFAVLVSGCSKQEETPSTETIPTPPTNAPAVP